uniref:Uncharacterized protein n=1 Tax=Cannabis sativa TaxID=3483 RepID=A0A803PMI3_CANSA
MPYAAGWANYPRALLQLVKPNLGLILLHELGSNAIEIQYLHRSGDLNLSVYAEHVPSVKKFVYLQNEMDGCNSHFSANIGDVALRGNCALHRICAQL